jgi:hypothetical protein
MKEGRRTDVADNCPKRNGNGGTLDATTTTAIMERPESLKFAETLSLLLQDYIRLNRQEVAGAAK